ncbi:MAG: hypothetical protein EOO09_09295 [Chitinophagaceae bacterium]|nr:MAG: hypothetical protein EOO09_09295 [Chitinophagaceae bacterium]
MPKAVFIHARHSHCCNEGCLKKFNMQSQVLSHKTDSGLPEEINRIAMSELPVVLVAPKDAGKEWIAELIHDLGPRNERPFLIINCLSSPSHSPLLELSYPIRREFADLQQLAAEGLLDAIRGGTVWINNLDDLSDTEEELLLQRISLILDCRIITGVSRQGGLRNPAGQLLSLKDRETLHLPQLRNHPVNVQFFLNYFLAKTNLEWNRTIPGFDEAATQALNEYAWPGNIPELRDLVRDAVFLGTNGEPVSLRLLPATVRSYQAHDPQFLKKAVLKAEYDLICKTLYETQNNKRKAAEILKISRKTLYSKMRIFQDALKFNLSPAG